MTTGVAATGVTTAVGGPENAKSKIGFMHSNETVKHSKQMNNIMVVYHLPKKSGNFKWNVNGKINLVSPKGNFLGKTGFLER